MPSNYPTSLDSLSTSNSNSTTAENTHPALHNDANSAINAIEAELGVNPSGAAATVAAAIAACQPLDSDLTAIAALSTTSFGRSFLELATAAAGRTLLGLGTASTQPTSAFDASGAAVSAEALTRERIPWSYRDHGLKACSLDDPAMATTSFAPEGGKPLYVQVPVRVASADFSTVRLVVATAGTGATALANCFVAVYSSTGTRLGVSADQSASWATAGEKGVSVTVDSGQSLTIAGGSEVFVWVSILVGTQSTTAVQFRAATATATVPNFAMAAAGKTLRAGTTGTGKTTAPTSFTPSELASTQGPTLAGVI